MIRDLLVVGPLDVNCYFIGDSKSREIMIIDPGGDAKVIHERVKKFNLNVIGIVNTHCHFDHVGAVKELVDRLGTDYLIHSKEISNLRNVTQQANLFGIDCSSLPEPDRLLNHRDRLAIGSINVEVLLTPGHSPGGICLYCKKTNQIITGDSLFRESIGRTDLPGGNTRVLLDAIQQYILSLPGQVQVYPGHGPSTTIEHEIQNNPFF